ncbi:Tetratricopeptide repeat-containing protein [Saccharopolyspora kobensis]|uniref:Tetratricopeptide repeat-containing protein n=1 Tax=Saccharopolyspora kobensis TaxID=146035 RepID=A0A1H6ECM8_9PSEU|nr:tetratricopeptide repeat protein [Saccharopolyspora kobensis]SEG94555.1 Tetratricopeptide repeat-containing protein [Saccharopolyspora kobensis]SFD64408.1 Tetratricopeptide repeat-containing protein [Saccharopolyspora kobensis]
MYGKAFAPEFQGALRNLSVNTNYEDALAKARAEVARATEENDGLALSQARLVESEACRRLGRIAEADVAWRASFRAAKAADEPGAMAWALWNGGTLARQRGQMTAALRWLGLARDAATRAGDVVALGYSVAGIAETLRIRGDYAEARDLHEKLLAEARKRGETRHTVWALEGLAQLDRNAGDLDAAWERFAEAAQIAEDGGDERGLAWALRGMADVLSLRGEHDEALRLLSKGEQICRRMDLSSALAYNRKMRGNILFRACWYGEATRTYEEAQKMFRAINEPRGAALAELGLLKSRDKLGRPRPATERDLIALRDSLDTRELRHTRKMVQDALDELIELVA